MAQHSTVSANEAKGVRLAKRGDKTERSYWQYLRNLIPHYEDFWQMHVFPLRSKGSIWFRSGLDQDCERVAIANYSTFSATARAWHKIYSAHDRYKYPEELYAALQRAIELGVKLASRFTDLFQHVAERPCPVSSQTLTDFKDNRLSLYRNLLHDELLAKPKDLHGKRLIPKPEQVDKYRDWTSVMYDMNPNDFVRAEVQIKNDFRSSCSRLEELWKEMCLASKAILDLPSYHERLAKGHDAWTNTGPSPKVESFVLGSDSQFIVMAAGKRR
jgi:hypothetical protein